MSFPPHKTTPPPSHHYWRWCFGAIFVWTLALGLSLSNTFNDNDRQLDYVHRVIKETSLTQGSPIPDISAYDMLVQDELANSFLAHLFACIVGCSGMCLLTHRFVTQTQLRNEIERVWREDATEFRTCMEASTAGLYRIKDMKFDYVNPAMAHMLGYEVDELVGLTPMEIVAPFERERVHGNTIRRAQGEPGAPYEVMCQRKDGSQFHAITWSNRIIYNGIYSTVGSLIDINERIIAEDNLRKAMDALVKSNAELEHFAYVASHDLQEPLRTITAFSQLLQRRGDNGLDDETRSYLGFVIAGAKRMHSLVNDLLAYSRVGSKGAALEPMDADQAFGIACQSLKESLEESGGTITADPLPHIMGGMQPITQLFQNLLGNALKFRRPGIAPHITVRVVLKDDWAQFSLADNGIGMAPEYQDQIFAMFRRLHNSQAYPGTGIGLAICKRIVEYHGGKIWVDSAEGQGSCFHFTLRLAPPEVDQTHPAIATPSA